MPPLRVLVVGAGFMGTLHARAVQGSRQATLCAVVDRSGSVASAAGAELGVPGYRDLSHAIDQARPDAAIIATPDPAHREPAETVLAAGLPVLVEKPLATTVADAEAIAGLAEQRSARLMTGHIGRFHPRYALGAAAGRGGDLGAPVMVTVATFGQTALGARARATTNPLWHFAIHDIDAMQWATGGTVAAVDGAQFVNSPGGSSIFAATGGLSTGGGFHLTAGWSLPGDASPRRTLTVHCEHGVAEAVWGTDGVSIATAAGTAELDCLNWPVLDGAVAGALRLEIEHFLSAVADGTPFAITPAEAVAAVRSAAALEQAAVVRRAA